MRIAFCFDVFLCKGQRTLSCGEIRKTRWNLIKGKSRRETVEKIGKSFGLSEAKIETYGPSFDPWAA